MKLPENRSPEELRAARRAQLHPEGTLCEVECLCAEESVSETTGKEQLTLFLGTHDEQTSQRDINGFNY